ncbi:tetratricopeptide repeat protein [Methanocella conradii]|uniref:tetratricopeptide repeat protein n=1 Tax=Methanocella conradii TaxID=1175444 RepID=UPI0024B35D2C|nr:tetratricopeptide repeat protein [Methanocella conradii]MDI6897254.1 tetratricopeptide repeat protein [Methanocella conradii]
MLGWAAIKELGGRLGATIDGDMADKLSSSQDGERSLELINSSMKALNDRYPPEIVDAIMKAVMEADLSGKPAGWRQIESLSRDVFERLSTNNTFAGEPFDEFYIRFKRFARWFRAALEAVISLHGLKKEDIALDNPAIKDYLIELKELPSRRLGELSFAYRRHGYDTLSHQIQALLDKYMDSVITRDNCRAIVNIMNKVAGHPGYFKAMGAEQKLIEIKPLLLALSGLQLYSGKEPEKADLLAALSILLFNVFPSQKLLKLMSRFEPSPKNDELLYDHCAIIAMNYMLLGRLDLAAKYNERALSYAHDEEKRAYALILESCIHLSRKDFDKAIAALSRCSSVAGDKRMRATAQFYLGIVYYETDRLEEAMECFRLSRDGLEDELDAMSACNNIGTCAMLQGDLKAAIREFEGVEYIGRYMTGNTAKSLMSVAYGNLGIIYLNMMEYDRAIGYLKKALKLDKDTHDNKGVANHLANIGLALEARREYKLALEHFKSALNISFMCDYLEGALFSFSRIERLMALEGRFEDAEALKQEMARRNPGISRMLSE